MAFLHDDVLDGALAVLKNNAETLHICSAEPSTYTQATDTYDLGYYSNPSFTGPSDGDTSGRKLRCDAVSGGTVTANGYATHWALVDDTNQRLLAAEGLDEGQTVTSGNPFSLTAFDVEIPDAQ